MEQSLIQLCTWINQVVKIHAMSIEQEIKSWDGKSSSDITAIYDRYGHSDDFVKKISQFFADIALQKAATWLLKHHFETDQEIKTTQVTKIVGFLPKLEHWESKLHVLQCLPFIEIVNTQKKEIEFFLRQCLTDENKFVRAWAYNGFYELSKQHAEYVTETKQFLEMALRDEAPSVKARIRNILKTDESKLILRMNNETD